MARTRITHEVDDAIIDENTKGRPEIALFAKTLNRLLAEKNVHQDDLAQALGISTGSVSNYRNGKKAPGFTMIVKMANYLGVDCNYLMTGVQAKNYVSAKDLGLSEKALNRLQNLHKAQTKGLMIKGYEVSYISLLSDLIEAGNDFYDLLGEIAFFMVYGGILPSQAYEPAKRDLGVEAWEQLHYLAKSFNREVASRDDLRELHLQLAGEKLKAICRDILQKELGSKSGQGGGDNGKH